MIDVACAIIEQNGDVLIAQHGPDHHHPLLWEFPGGKLKARESAETCIVREVKEELGFEILPVQALPHREHAYPGRRPIRLFPLLCRVIWGVPRARVHHSIKWVSPDSLLTYPWCAADLPIVHHFIQMKQNLKRNY